MLLIQKRYFLFLAIYLASIFLCLNVYADNQNSHQAQLPEKGLSLSIATKIAKPFAMKDGDDNWYGISIELWEKIAKHLHLNYEWHQTNLSQLLEGVKETKYDAGIAAITITAEREKALDFSHSYFSTGLSIATPKNQNEGWRTVIRGVFSKQMMLIILTLAGILFIIGTITWLIERNKNPENFNPNPIKGISAGIWWAAVTMTTVGYGDMTPKTLGGRLVALFWMFASLLLVSAIIASVAASLTLAKITPLVSGPEDLPKARIATIKSSSSDAYLKAHKLRTKYYNSVPEGLAAVQKGDVDVMVYDAPLLQYLVQRDFNNQLIVLDTLFEKQNYGIAFPEGSPLREPVNRALLSIIHSEEWQRVLNHYLGE